jgi:hypothetical protein
MTKHNTAHRWRKDAASKLRSTDIRGWCKEWEVHPDVLGWLLEAYAKGEDEWAIIRCLNRLAAAEQTRMRNRRRMKQRRKMNWAPASP